MQAITTKYLGPTNKRGSRVVASCQARRRVYSWDNALNADANHMQAAQALATELGWNYGTWIEGHLPDGVSVFVCDIGDSFTVVD